MPRTKPQPPPLQIRLSTEDSIRLQNLTMATGKTRGALAREALLNYLDQQEHRLTEKREGELERRLKKMEDRLAGLWVRNSIDVGMIFLLMYRHMDKKERSTASKWAYAGSVKRLKQKLKDSEVLMRDRATGKAGDDENSPDEE